MGVLAEALQRPGPRLAADRRCCGCRSWAVWPGGVAARFTRTLGTLLINGVPLIAALGIVRDAVGNTAGVAAIEAATLQCQGRRRAGRPAGEAG